MTSGRDDHYLVERLRERFAEDPRLGELGLEVHLTAGMIHVHGEVATAGRREAIADIVREVAPELGLRNEVQVTEVVPSASEEVLE